MQRKIGTEIEPGKTVSPFNSISVSSAINRTVSNYTDSGYKVRKLRKLIETGTYDAKIAQYILGTLNLNFQGILEDIDTKEQPVHSSHRDMENLNFQILLTDNYYTNPNNIHLCFPMKIKRATKKDADIDDDLITVNNFFAYLINEKSIRKYGKNKQLIPTFSPYEINRYSDAILKHLPKSFLKKIQKMLHYDNTAVYYNKTTEDKIEEELR